MTPDAPAPDAFALLGFARRPLLDTDEVNAAFLAAAAPVHPDAAGGGDAARFRNLDEAKKKLESPRWRLRHLLELEYPGVATRAPEAVPPALAARFAQASAVCARADALLARRAAASSALARAMLAREVLTVSDELQEWLASLQAQEAETQAALQAIDARWESGDRDAAVILRLQQAFAYLSRWSEQARERMLALLRPE